ncbi:alpha-hydroxy-acid oxidizing protein [Azospirillum doebereinerae]|uniref:alpha-hydroxy acid oxidase n=1 Tax=Azospirillum doebereinerae TaxID=92933 RepID=UPI001EE57E46|nr:alpha-hydroxy acid oxidase [Azospirillum doebereinerae]MCG5243312.1 alpha-hydroxy-acid oxidizing protein [Azospirillum doebereinerae]
MIPTDIAAVTDYEPHARARMGENAWAYIAGGSADETTLRWNVEAFSRLKLQAQALPDLRDVDTRVTLFGQTLAHPILLAPTAYHKLVHPEGELATALGAAALEAAMVVSTQASVTLEDIAAQSGAHPLWFQLYLQADRALSGALVRRAEAAGYRALVVTVDAPVSLRNREQRAGFALPPGVEAANLRGQPQPPVPEDERAALRALLASSARWADIAWLRGFTRLPILLKGITTPEDAERAIAHGADGIIVSNHGGRVLDTVPATIEALPAVAARVDGRVPLLLDGGVRRGTDALKALALGASAVLIGRPYLHGLAVGGAVGVAHVLKILRTELEIAMILTGRSTLAGIDRTVLWPED